MKYPRASEEHVRLSSQHGASSGLSTGLLVDTNLDTSIPDAYRPPPAPLPFDVGLVPSQTGSVAQEIHNSKRNALVQTTNSDSGQDAIDVNAQNMSTESEGLNELDCKAQSNVESELLKKLEVELSKSAESIVSATEEEDVCPICLEEYDAENPKITTKCDHHFHLACILEWMERSDTCPVCDQEVIINTPY
ncbi:hypothetical protein SLEP1_g32913 [Rubroshorea leprosula]|uniref:RING-type E3 ubiquitin transferase n=1 Tax=Rubroshorea leprosula TaxID=152421 RepID=A0AAV5KEX2_9ROSI|nr:hypothetical protein SLEP1_g32913 [Rubroshorea leprosula]